MGVFDDLVDEGIRDTAETETTAENGAVGFEILDRLGGRGEDLVDGTPALAGCECASNEKGLKEKN